ncbi:MULTISPECIES: hypothetical protein [Stenotrophomonas]|uniref:hypothetical protein n=1 Tax=Stenotrophomonas TaxID=40323 RepID=UPI003397550A
MSVSGSDRVGWRRRSYRKAGTHQEMRAHYGTSLMDGSKTFHPPTRMRPDDDNMLARSKPYRDGIADALGIDDKRFMSHPLVSNEVRKRGQVVVRITGGPAAAGHSTTGERA